MSGTEISHLRSSYMSMALITLPWWFRNTKGHHPVLNIVHDNLSKSDQLKASTMLIYQNQTLGHRPCQGRWLTGFCKPSPSNSARSSCLSCWSSSCNVDDHSAKRIIDSSASAPTWTQISTLTLKSVSISFWWSFSQFSVDKVISNKKHKQMSIPNHYQYRYPI